MPPAAPPPISPAPQAQAGVAARVVTRSPAAPGAVQLKKSGQFNLGMGILGGFLGAILASGLVVGISLALGFKIPLFGFIIGLVSGLGAKWLAKGKDRKLGFISAGISLASTVGSLMLLFGADAFTNVGCLVSMVVCVTMAWKIAG